MFDVLGQSLECSANQRCRAGDIARRDRQALTRLEQHRLVIFELRRPDLGPLKVAQNAEWLMLFAAYFANHLDKGKLFLVRAVGEIQANNIDSRAH